MFIGRESIPPLPLRLHRLVLVQKHLYLFTLQELLLLLLLLFSVSLYLMKGN